jgi:hypothetical protein
MGPWLAMQLPPLLHKDFAGAVLEFLGLEEGLEPTIETVV